MKFVAAALALLLGLNAQAELVCGLYQTEDFSDTMVVSLIDFRSVNGMTKTFNVSNANDPVVRGMVSARCYCVIGDVQLDPAFAGDTMFQIIEIHSVPLGPYMGCTPNSVVPSQMAGGSTNPH